VREAARVARVVAVGFAAACAFGAGPLARFLGTASSAAAFSLSSLDISSLARFFARVELVSLVMVDFTAGLVATRLVASLSSSLGAAACCVLVVGAARVLRVVAAGAAAFLDGTALAAADVVGSVPLRRSVRGSWRLVGGMRLTRRSRRDWRLAHWASH